MHLAEFAVVNLPEGSAYSHHRRDEVCANYQKFRFHGECSHGKRACARRCPFASVKKDVVHEGVKCLPTASSAAHTQGTGLRHLPFLRAARRKYTPVIRERGRAGNGLKGHPSIEQSGRQESTRDAADVRFGS